MGSLYKRCPFKKGFCNDSCALYDSSSIEGCSFLQIAKSLEYIGADLMTVKEILNPNNKRKQEEDEEGRWYYE